MVFVFGVFEAWGIRVGNQGVQGQWGDCVAVGGVEVHVFGEAVGVEEIVAGPAFGGIGEIGGVEVYGDFVAGAVDDIFFVYFFNEISYVAVARVISDLPRVGACGAYLFVDVAQIVDGIAFDDARIAAEIELRAANGISVTLKGILRAELSTRMRSQ